MSPAAAISAWPKSFLLIADLSNTRARPPPSRLAARAAPTRYHTAADRAGPPPPVWLALPLDSSSRAPAAAALREAGQREGAQARACRPRAVAPAGCRVRESR